MRLYGWGRQGYGIVKPVLFTARNGSTLSGHVWMTSDGPREAPGIVITNGSVQAPEELYWFAATTLAKAGYIVMTWDPQGQGRSDTYGEGADRNDGVPSQTGAAVLRRHRGRAGLLLLHAGEPVRAAPVAARPAPSHARQAARPRRSTAGTPRTTRSTRCSTRAASASPATRSAPARVSYVGQIDPRVKAIVAWDNLRGAGHRRRYSLPVRLVEAAPTPPAAKPALGMSADYGLTPTPYTAEPDPQRARAPASHALHGGRRRQRASSSSAAAPTTSSRSSRTRASARRCAARTWPPGTRPPGSTATSRATRRRPRGCSPTAGATTPPRPPSTPTTTATCSRSTTTRRCGSTGARARTCARLRAARSRPTGWARSRRSEQRASGDGGDGRTRPMSPRCS